MHILRKRLFLAVSIGHTTVDIFNSAAPVLIVFLSIPLNLSNAQVGLAASLYAFAGSMSQPVFGWLGDRYGQRWLAGLGVGWTAAFIALTTFLATTGNFIWVLIPYTLAALGSGAFHPTGATSASNISAKHTATATALFFLFGQIGLASGPLLGGFLLDYVGLIGLQLLALGAIPVVIFMLTTPYPTQKPIAIKPETTAQEDTVVAPQKIAWGAIATLALLTATRSWAQIGTITFLPKLFQDKGWDATSYGAITGAMWFASAIMGVLAGQAADRWGRRQVVFITLLGSVIPLYLLPESNGWLAFIPALLAGGLTGAPHSIIVVIAQALLPGKKNMATGFTLGFMFGMGAVASLVIGWLADTWGLAAAMQIGAGMALISSLLAFALPQTRQSSILETEVMKAATP